jgi:hypothetical protein
VLLRQAAAHGTHQRTALLMYRVGSRELACRAAAHRTAPSKSSGGQHKRHKPKQASHVHANTAATPHLLLILEVEGEVVGAGWRQRPSSAAAADRYAVGGHNSVCGGMEAQRCCCAKQSTTALIRGQPC